MPRGYRQIRRRQRGGRLRQLHQQLTVTPQEAAKELLILRLHLRLGIQIRSEVSC